MRKISIDKIDKNKKYKEGDYIEFKNDDGCLVHADWDEDKDMFAINDEKSDIAENIQISFKKDGWGLYTNGVRNKGKTAKRFLKLCLTIINNPEMIYHAFGLCEKNEKGWIEEAISEINKHGRRY